jgi:hypothetical protein
MGSVAWTAETANRMYRMRWEIDSSTGDKGEVRSKQDTEGGDRGERIKLFHPGLAVVGTLMSVNFIRSGPFQSKKQNPTPGGTRECRGSNGNPLSVHPECLAYRVWFVPGRERFPA